MKTAISLKELRNDPRHYVHLLNGGYEVAITDHRRELVRARAKRVSNGSEKGNGNAILEYIKNMPKIKTPYPDEDTVALMKRTRLEYLERKFGYKR